jgi:naphthoate synthase
MVSELFDEARWRPVEGFTFTDITYHRAVDQGTVRVAFHRPEVRNAFRPHTVDELFTALDHARQTADVGCVLLTGNGPSPRDGGWAFCSGGDQRIRGRAGYQYATGETAETVDRARTGRLHILEVQRLIRFMPKVVIAVVPGWAAGGGHSLHVVCDLTLASRQHARFKQTDADVGSFDGGFGSAYLARQVGQKFAREIFFLGDEYSAADAHRMGMVNAVVPHSELESVALEWAAKVNGKSPTAQRMQRAGRRTGGPAALRRRSHPPGVHDRRGRRGPRRLPGEARPRLERVSLVLLNGSSVPIARGRPEPGGPGRRPARSGGGRPIAPSRRRPCVPPGRSPCSPPRS